MKKCMFFSITAVFIVAVMLMGCETDTGSGKKTVSVTSITGLPESAEMTVGDPVWTPELGVLPANASNKTLTWALGEGDDAVTLGTSADGKMTVRAVKDGDATITVTAKGGKNITAVCAVTVKLSSGPVAVESVSLNRTGYTSS